MAIDFPDTSGINPDTGLSWATGDIYTDAGTTNQYALNSLAPVVWVGAGVVGNDTTYLRLDGTNSPIIGSVTTTSEILPDVDNSVDLGSTTQRWANIFTGDLHLANDRGDWTMIEESDYLSLRDNKSGTVYRLMMEPVS